MAGIARCSGADPLGSGSWKTFGVASLTLDENLCRLLNDRADRSAGFAQTFLDISFENSVNHAVKWLHFALERLCQASTRLEEAYPDSTLAA